MPQMGPMMWIIFPLIMMIMLMLKMGTLDGEMNVIVMKSESDLEYKRKMMW